MNKLIPSALLSAFASLAALPLSAQGPATFAVTSTGTNPTIDAAVEFTTAIWEDHLLSDQPIKVNLIYMNLTSAGPLGITFPNGRKDFPSAPFDSLWYPTCLANAINSTENNPGEYDMDIYLNSYYNWYFGTDGNPGPTQYDFVSVLLHEIGHGLGFLSLAKSSAGEGSLGNLTALDFFPIVTSFPWPDQQYLPSIYDHYIETTVGDHITDTVTFPNPGTALHGAFTGGGLWFNAPLSYAANSSVRVRLHAPSTFSLGTSVTHLNETTFPSSHPSTLMTPFISTGEVNHGVGDVTLAILEDIGWKIDYTVHNAAAAEVAQIVTFPNPCVDELHIRFQGAAGLAHITIMDANGRTVRDWELDAAHGFTGITCDVSDLADGLYLVRVENAEGTVVKKVLKAGAE